ncbi:hypothetical protein QOZ80_5AG0379890 [Eleusine coracana subsp. coracana]|nr:hypothetical protein QOZ80_5AG0379890 [Eleusine coracana subsp. coracana]
MAGAKADANTEAGDAAAAGGGGGGSGSFSEQRLAEKLNKLNNSAASIQTLSQWCIFHRKRARRVVDTWEKQFNSAINDKKISYLYLSNDILQNSKRKGGEYVNEFWRVLPRSLKYVYENGEDEGKKVVARLIGIWDERKVFGSRIESLKDDILGGSLPTLDSNEKNSNPSSNPSSNSKSARKDSSTTVKKLIVGGMPEKIVTAYQSVLDKHFDEDTALNKCKSTVVVLENINKDAEDACKYGIQQGSSLISNLQEQETILKQCIEQLEGVDSVRATLINQLREALSEQESKLELLRSQLQVARGQAECVLQLRRRLNVAPIINGMGSSSNRWSADFCWRHATTNTCEPSTSSMPPPPPLPNILSAGYATPSGPPPPPPLPPAPGQPQQQSPQAPQQSPTSAGFFHSSGIGFFPPVQVQQSPSVQRQ